MSAPMYLLDGGAVTAVGLDRPQTCAGIRARVSPFDQLIRSAPFGDSLTVARIPAAWQLRRTPLDWLVNLATRAIREVLERHALDPAATVLLMLPPETFRQPVFDDHEPDPGDPLFGRLLARVAAEAPGPSRAPFLRALTVPAGGPGALAAALDLAQSQLGEPGVRQVLLVAADGYVLEPEFDRLTRAHRLRTPRQAQGLIPGEGAACLWLSRSPAPSASASSAASPSDRWLHRPRLPVLRLSGWASATERQSALSDEQSQGRAIVQAMRDAASRAGTAEPDIDWVVSNDNGERYAAWEATLAQARYFRTRRERLHVELPSTSVGEIGAAAAPLALLTAAHRFLHAGAGTRHALVALASEAGERSACLLSPVEDPAP